LIQKWFFYINQNEYRLVLAILQACLIAIKIAGKQEKSRLIPQLQ
jgi:hypothetical protein